MGNVTVIENGNIFDSEAQAIANATNCIGVMGAGLALAFQRKYPIVCDHYNYACAEYQKQYTTKKFLTPAVYIPYFVDDAMAYPEEDTNHQYIIQFPTMIFPGERASIERISRNLLVLKEMEILNGIKKVALPALGCGIGRLPFDELLEQVKSTEFDFDVDLYAPR